jgi:hypothetical protein
MNYTVCQYIHISPSLRTSTEGGSSPCWGGARRHRPTRHHRSFCPFPFVLSFSSFTPGFICLHFCVYMFTLLPAQVCAVLFYFVMYLSEVVHHFFCYTHLIRVLLRSLFVPPCVSNGCVCCRGRLTFGLCHNCIWWTCLLKVRISDISALLHLTPSPTS